MEDKKIFIAYGIINVDSGEYNMLAKISGSKKISRQRLINAKLETIPDNKFVQLLFGERNAELKIENHPAIILHGQIIGGSDPTRVVREQVHKIKPKQELKVLLDEPLNKDLEKKIEGKRAQL